MRDTRFSVHDPVDISEVTGQLGVRAFKDTRTLAKIALFETGIFRASLGQPEIFALVDGKFGRVAVLQHFAVLLDAFLYCIVRVGRACKGKQRGYCCSRQQRRPVAGFR